MDLNYGGLIDLGPFQKEISMKLREDLKPDSSEVRKNPTFFYIDGEKVFECENQEDQILFSTVDME